MGSGKGVYKGRRVLVTGHTGFKGSWLALWLDALGARVKGYSLEPPTTPSMFEAVGLEQRVDHTLADIRDFDRLQSVFETFKPQTVFHLAAQSLVRRSYREPRETMATNVSGTVNLLEAARLCPSVESVVIVTSDKCYEENTGTDGYREKDRLGGRDPYSASKGMAELAVSAYRSSFPSPAGIASVRAGNVIGGGDWGEDRLVPDCVRAFTAGDAVEVRMPKAVRPWQFVLEPLSGYLLLGARLMQDPDAFSGAYNFGPLEERTITAGELVDRFIRSWGSGSWKPGGDEGDSKEATSLKLCWDKARDQMGWQPVYSLDEALEETITWYKAYPGGGMYELTLSQIEKYEARQKTDV